MHKGVFAAAALSLAGTLSADVNLLVKETASAPVVDGNLDDAAWSESEWTAPWSVLGRENANVNGLFETADDKFAKNASTAALLYDKENLYVAIRSPFPADAPPKTGDSGIWGDDHVEFFFQYDQDAFFQVAVSVTGLVAKVKYNGLNSWPRFWQPQRLRTAVTKSATSFDVEMAIPFSEIGVKEPGRLWRGNFARDGRSCGGLSTWAPVGMNFCSQQGFGKFVFGSRGAYFREEVKRIAAAVPKEKRDVAFNAAFAKLTATVKNGGVSAESWDTVSALVAELQASGIRALNAGKSVLVRNCGLWDETDPVAAVPFGENPAEPVRLRAVRGARALGSFRISNLSAKTVLYHLNVLSAERDSEHESAFRFRNVEYVEINGGRMVPDPIFDLPMGRVISVPPHSTAVVWIDVEAARFNPGSYRGIFRLVPAYRADNYTNIGYELTVGKADISDVYLPNWTYPLRDPADIRFLKEYGFNTACLLPSHFAAEPGIDGFARTEAVVDALLANGVRKEHVNLILYVQWPTWMSTITLADGTKASIFESKWEEEFALRLKRFVRWIREKYGIGYDRLLLYTCEEPNGNPDDPKETAWYAIKGAELVRRIDPQLRTLTNPWRCEAEYVDRYLKLYDVLMPCLPRLLNAPKEVREKMVASGARMCSYSVLMKRSGVSEYRRMFWKHLALGFDGIATFYDLFDCSGDPFNSYDSKPKTSIIDDYQTCYRDRQNGGYAVSRRLESWYVGLVEFKLAMWCRKRIAALRAAGKDVTTFSKELAGIIDSVDGQGGDVETGAASMFALSERLSE